MAYGIYMTDDGRYIIAQHDERNHNYVANMHARGRRVTGCSQVSGRTIEALAGDGNVTVYRSLSAARRAFKRDGWWVVP